MADFTLAALKAEIVDDPRGYGYKNADGSWKGDQVIADLLNVTRDGTDGFAEIRIKRSDISGGEIFHAIAIADLVNNPGASSLEWFNALLHLTIPVRLLNDDGTATPVRENVISIVRSGTPTLERLAALETELASRAEELWGKDTQISASQVGHSFNA